MRIETVAAESEAEALERCPWAAEVVEVDTGQETGKSWKCFESVTDADAWKNQK